MADKFQNARLAFIKVGSTTFSAETASSINIRAAAIETTNKSNTSSAAFIPDLYQATASASHIVVFDDTTGVIQDLGRTFLVSVTTGSTQTAATLIFVLNAAGPTVTLTASAYVTAWDMEATQGGVLQGNCEFQLTGNITITETST